MDGSNNNDAIDYVNAGGCGESKVNLDDDMDDGGGDSQNCGLNTHRGGNVNCGDGNSKVDCGNKLDCGGDDSTNDGDDAQWEFRGK